MEEAAAENKSEDSSLCDGWMDVVGRGGGVINQQRTPEDDDD